MANNFKIDEAYKASYLNFLEDINQDPYNFEALTDSYAASQGLPQDWIDHAKAGFSIMLRDDQTISPEETMAIIDITSRATLLDDRFDAEYDPITTDFLTIAENEGILISNEAILAENERILEANQRALEENPDAELTALKPIAMI